MLVCVPLDAFKTYPNMYVETICACFSNVHELWAVPVEICISMWLLQRELGLPFLAPAAVAIISTASLVSITKYIGRAQRVWNEGIQTRVDVTASMLGSMKVSFYFSPNNVSVIE